MDRNGQVEIISRVLGGDREAYGLLIDAWKGPVFNLAYRMTGSLEDADDLSQETFLKAFEALGSFDATRDFFPWLYSICLNCVRNHLKKKRELPLPEGAQDNCLSIWHEVPDTPEQELIRNQERRQLDCALLMLSDESREAIVLRFYQGLSFEEIAQILGISAASVKMRVYRALEKLRTILNNEIR